MTSLDHLIVRYHRRFYILWCTAMAVLLISEVLFFVFNKFGREPVDQIKKVVADFFTVADVREAKELLRAELVRILCPDSSDRTRSELCKQVVADLPRLMTHNRGDNRGLLEVADLLDLLMKADEMNVLDKLPTFVAASYDKIPVVKPEDLDICLIARRLSKLEDTVSGHTRTLIEAADKADLNWPPLAGSPHDSWAAISSSGNSSGLKTADLPARSAAAAAQSRQLVHPQERIQSVRSGQGNVRQRTLKGKCDTTSGSSAVKGVPRQLHAFVCRLADDTTESSLSDWLAGVGIIGAACRKIVPKDGRVFKTSAFKVSCDSKYADLFYNEASWPLGCELRDWYVKQYDSNVAH